MPPVECSMMTRQSTSFPPSWLPGWTMGPLEACPESDVPEPDSAHDALFDAAAKAQGRMDYREAIDLYMEINRLDPDLAEAYVNRGAARYLRGDLFAALEDFSRAVAIEPRAKTYLSRGNVNLRRHSYDEAIRDYRKAIDLDSGNVDAFASLGYTHYLRGDHSEAVGHYDEALAIAPRYSLALVGRGASHAVKGDFQGALGDFEKALEMDPECGVAHRARGWVLVQKGECGHAVQELTRALELDPSDVHSLAVRGSLYLAEGDLDRAIRDFDEALSRGLEDARVYNDRGVAHERRGDAASAMQDYDRALEVRPNEEAFVNRGVARLRLSEWDEARSDLTYARNMGVDLVSAFRSSEGSVADFEQSHSVSLPQDVSDLVSLEEDPGPSMTGAHLNELFRKAFESVPAEAYDALPTDGSINYKHYLYGWPKK